TYSGDVRLSIYNLLGEQIMQLVNGFLEAGIHTVNFNASDLNSGVYLYKFETNGIIQSRKMILAK
ncbi:MAG: T9SS type A sorting domain-containing protein, partial [Ignavibacteriaceae bacterium]|nr:T9SS type A sorting domain-containing protein [Ignavibacteriaceae bacterium]